METFTWLPDQGYDSETDFGVQEVQFGNGVTQVQQRFLTPPREKFSLNFSRSSKEITAIWNFLRARRGQRFLWKCPDGRILKVRCTKLQKKTTGLVDSLSCEFKEELL